MLDGRGFFFLLYDFVCCFSKILYRHKFDFNSISVSALYLGVGDGNNQLLEPSVSSAQVLILRP